MMRIFFTVLFLLLSVVITHAQPTPTCNRYASPTATGSENGLTPGTAYRIVDFMSDVQTNFPTVKTLCLADGTYQGVNQMINPWEQLGSPTRPFLDGTASDQITIRCLNHNQCIIDGQKTNHTVWLSSNRYWTFIGITAINGRCSNFRFSNNLNGQNTVYMGMSVDAGLAVNGSVNGNCMGFAMGQGDNNRCIDCAHIGSARKGWEAISGTGALCQRCYVKWMFSNGVGPKMCYSAFYTSTDHRIFNSICNWDTQAYEVGNPGTYPTTIQCDPVNSNPQCGDPINSPADIDQTYGFFSGDNVATTPTPRARIYGSIGYLLPFQEYISSNNWSGLSNLGADWWQAENVAIGFDPGALTTRPPMQLFNLAGGTISNSRADNITTYGTVANVYQSEWIEGVNYSNHDTATTPGGVSSIFTSATGAQICYEYDETGTLTAQPLWPLPITEAVKAASVAAGYTQIDITADIQAAFGTIPAQCLRSAPPAAASTTLRQNAILRQNATIR